MQPPHPPDRHDRYDEIVRRLDRVESELEDYVSKDLHRANLETVLETIKSVRGEIRTLQQADQQRRQQVLGVIGAIAVALIVALIQSGVLTS